MKIKIIRKTQYVDFVTQSEDSPEPCVIETYDIYVGFVGWPSTWNPFGTKWILDKAGLSSDEVMKYLKWYILSRGKIKIITK